MVTHHSILLIDDSPGECELFRLALIQTGLTVTLFTEQNADAAFHFLNNHSSDLPTLILLDWHLGRQRGDEFLKRLRADSRLAAIPVVVFTTSDDASDLALAYASGANGYVVKPGTFAELIQCAGDLCRYWLERNRVPLTIGTPC
jgi:DNA-binding response OmpR family regulator